MMDAAIPAAGAARGRDAQDTPPRRGGGGNGDNGDSDDDDGDNSDNDNNDDIDDNGESGVLARSPAAACRAPSRDEALRKGRLLLVAEDNPSNQRVIVMQLALLGFTADVADNGRLALEQWRQASYALLLTDLHMPDMDGYQLAAAIRLAEEKSGIARRIPILALTANALNSEAESCRASGMDDYLSKPLKLAELKMVLDTWLPRAIPQQLTAPAPAFPPTSTLTSLATRMPATPAQAPTSAVSPVDIGVLAHLIGNDPEQILEMLSEFRSGALVIAAPLSAACAEGWAREASVQAHKLKSSARAVGALALGDLCAQIEAAGEDGDRIRLRALAPLLTRELDEVMVFLDALQGEK